LKAALKDFERRLAQHARDDRSGVSHGSAQHTHLVAGRPDAQLATPASRLPGRDNDIRAAFDLMCEQLGLRYRLRAEVDDMAMLRLLARDSDSVALLPTVVVQDELRSGQLVEYGVVPDLHEDFYAITVQRHFSPPLLKALLKQSEADVLGALSG
jgi:LysR family transcriptional regulator, transcriptional activator of nhaA